MSFTANDITQAVAQLLLASAVAGMVDNRIRPLNAATPDHRPLVTYQVVDDDTFDTMQGSALWQKVELQIDAFADDYETARAILQACKTDNSGAPVLHNFSGIVGNVTIGVSRRQSPGVFDATEPPDIGEEQPVIRLQSSYSIIYHT